MTRRALSVLGGLAAIALTSTTVPGPALAAPAATPTDDKTTPTQIDNRHDPLSARQAALNKRAAELVATGKAQPQDRGGSKAVRVAPGQWAEYGTQSTGHILSFLVDFGNQTDARPGMETTPGPVHNTIPQPDRSSDNSTYWRPDFNREHYQDMFFNGLPEQNGESFAGVYNEMSSGRYTVTGDVSDWVTVPYNEASYGTTESNTDMTRFIGDSATAWYDAQKAAGKTDAEITKYLQQFDQWDRFDYDGDGNYNEPDGYIDHFQAIHAGKGEEAGAPHSAIWSHRWAAGQAGLGTDGPDQAKFGGVEIGDTGVWIRDYTTEPENGGLGVFAHEFGHDLGLPDYYDTSGGDNGTAFWTLMSSGSWMNHGADSIGTTPNQMGPQEKLQLGWLDHATAKAGSSGGYSLGPSFHATKHPQALLVQLPDGQATTDVGAPAADGGSKYLYSGNGDDRTATATSPAFTVPAGGQLTASARYAIEDDFDYAYAEISSDAGSHWTPVATNLSTDANPNGQNQGHGITGSSKGQWVALTADLSQYAGQQVQLRFRMVNDAGYHDLGFEVDNIAVGPALTENAESGAPDWTMNGFSVADQGKVTTSYTQYYLAENRQYLGYDKTLAEGPYNFGWANTAPDKVERFPYQNGLLVWFVNNLYTDNNTSGHPGGGASLPVDANAGALRWSDGTVARSRIQAYDATFGLERTDPLSLHREAKSGGTWALTTLTQPAQAATPVFDDSNPNAYYDPANPQGSAVVAGTGTRIRVVSQNSNGLMTVKLN